MSIFTSKKVDKFSSVKIWPKKDKEIKVSPLMPIRVKKRSKNLIFLHLRLHEMDFFNCEQYIHVQNIFKNISWNLKCVEIRMQLHKRFYCIALASWVLLPCLPLWIQGRRKLGFRARTEMPPPPIPLCWKHTFLRTFLGKQTETVEVRQACQSQGYPQISWFYLN